MSEVQTPRVEMEARPGTNMPALQARMLLRDTAFLNPANEAAAPLLSKETVGVFQERSYGLYEKASTTERRDYWNKKTGEGASFDARYQTWSSETVRCFTSEKNQQTIGRLAPLLTKIGAPGTFTADSARNIYNRYLDDAPGGSGVKSFVADVLDAYRTDGKLNHDAMMRDRDAITWMANIFGATSSQVVEQLFAAEAALETNPACFDELNVWVNKVTAPEKKLMEFIWNQKAPEVTKKPPEGEPAKPEDDSEDPPIAKYKDQIQAILRDPNTDNLIVSAETGAGKTTQLPQYVFELLGDKEMVAVTQPRRLPTESLADRVAGEMGVELGDITGFKHGKGENRSENTQVDFRTEGSLRVEVMRDQLLMKYNYVIVDEWHERHKDMDILVGLLRRAQQMRRDKGLHPLKLVFASATINGEKLKSELGAGTQLLEVEGRSKEIDDRWITDLDPSLTTSPTMDQRVTLAAQAAARMVAERGRHIVIFMPGERRIQDTQKALEALQLPPNVVIDTLSGSMTPEEQKARIKPTDGKVHIIIATNVAETSLTIKGVDVISSGYANILSTDPATGLTYLREQMLPNMNIKQQRGRTGRESDGVFWYLGSKEEYLGEKRVNNNPPEITRSDLSNEVLYLSTLGLDFNSLDLIDRGNIPSANIGRAVRRLKILGALDANKNATDMGREMAHMKLDIHLARMLIEARKRHCARMAATVAAMVNEYGSLFVRLPNGQKEAMAEKRKKAFPETGSDFLTLLHYYERFQEVGSHTSDKEERETQRRAWAEEYGLQYDTLVKVGVARDELLGREKNVPDTGTTEDLERCVVVGYRDNLLKKNADGRTRRVVDPTTKAISFIPIFTMTEENVQNAQLDRSSQVDTSRYGAIVTVGNYRRQKPEDPYQYMQINQRVDPTWL